MTFGRSSAGAPVMTSGLEQFQNLDGDPFLAARAGGDVARVLASNVPQDMQPPAIAPLPACDAQALAARPKDMTSLNVPAEETDSGPLGTPESRRRTGGRKLATYGLALDDAPRRLHRVRAARTRAPEDEHDSRSDHEPKHDEYDDPSEQAHPELYETKSPHGL